MHFLGSALSPTASAARSALYRQNCFQAESPPTAAFGRAGAEAAVGLCVRLGLIALRIGARAGAMTGAVDRTGADATSNFDMTSLSACD